MGLCLVGGCRLRLNLNNMEEIKLQLKKSSWDNLFKVIREIEIKPKGGFWASIQYLESQLEEKESEYSLSITEDGFKINGILINDKIFQEELCDYWVRERADQIDHLIDWIAEATTDKQAMKDDLLYLSRKKGEYLFSSIVTNDYVLEEDNLERFNEICKELLKLNEGLEK